MSVAEETLDQPTTTSRKQAPILNRVLDFVSSVRVGVVQLCILVVLAMAGMLIMQQNVEGFDAYYASLTPAEKTVFGALGLFNIYYSWYFELLLLTLSLNIVLASIDHFPSAWSYIVEPKLTATRDWLLGQRANAVIELENTNESKAAEKIKGVFQSNGLKPTITTTETKEYGVGADGRKDFSTLITRKNIVVFGESGKTNRLGAYIVHVALLTLFLGHFVFLTTSFDADVRMIPGAKTDQIQLIKFDLDKRERFTVQLPFSMECTDIQQRLINEKGSIDVSNTLDWRTQLKIDDPQYGITVEEASLNKPLFYRGYRFFQAQTIPIGHARNITLDLIADATGQVTTVEIPRNGSTALSDGTKIEFTDFQPDFVMGSNGLPDTRSGDYNMPVAVLDVTPAGGERTRVFAMPASIADNIPMGKSKLGYKWRLAQFEKSPMAHVLAIKYDPFNASIIAWYVGGFGLVGSLMFVFFFSHRRVWAHVAEGKDGKIEIVLGGDANRNQIPFEDKFKKIADSIRQDR